MEIKPHEVYTVEEIAEMCDSWANYQGHSGETCYSCKKTANVFTGGLGWVCGNCGQFNAMDWHGSRELFEHPDQGTPAAIIKEGHSLSTRWDHLFHPEKYESLPPVTHYFLSCYAYHSNRGDTINMDTKACTCDVCDRRFLTK